MSIFLRAAKLADALAIADVYLASRATFLAYPPLAHSDTDIRVWIETQLIPGASVTVAEVGGKVVGFVATVIDEPLLWVDQLYVRPNSVGLGLGGKLLQHALAGIRQPVRL